MCNLISALYRNKYETLSSQLLNNTCIVRGISVGLKAIENYPSSTKTIYFYYSGDSGSDLATNTGGTGFVQVSVITSADGVHKHHILL